MSKTVGYVLTAAMVVFAIAVPIIGIPALAATLITTALTAAIMINSMLMPKPKVSANAQEIQLQIGEVSRRAIFGRSATAGSLVDAFNYGGKYGTDHEVVVFALADHFCEELEGVYVNDKWVPWAGDGNYAAFDGSHLSMYFRQGDEVQTLPSVITIAGPGWGADNYGAGICYAVVDYRADAPDAKHPAWPGGRPTFLWVLKGKRCYDPRLDTSVGGSGSHRWSDPTTWEYSANPVVCHYNYARGIYACDRVNQPSQLLVGRGLSATEVPPANIFAHANLCDEVMDDTLPRYAIGAVVSADETFLDVAEKFAAACGGIIVQPEGSVEIEPGQAKTPSFAFTDADLVVGSDVEWNEGILSTADSEWVNTIIPRYVSPEQRWQDHSAPIRRDSVDLITDRGPREEEVVLQFVTNERQASDIGEIHRKLGRIWGRGKVMLPPRFAEIEEGDWGYWTSDRRFGGESKVFRVESYALDGKWQIALTLRQIESAVYDGVFAEGGSTGTAETWAETDAPPDVGEPDSANWALSAVMVADPSGLSVPALEVTGDASDDESAEALIFEYWKDDGVIDPIANPDDPAWSVYGTFPRSTTKVDITGIEGGATYYVAITYIVGGISGDRLVLGPATAASATADGIIDSAFSGSLTATEAITAGQFVNIYASSGGKVRKANATDDTKPVNGFAQSSIANAATGNVRGSGGKISGLSGLTPGGTYYLSTTGGAITTTPPSTAGNLVQEVGVAVSATELLFNPKIGVTV